MIKDDLKKDFVFIDIGRLSFEINEHVKQAIGPKNTHLLDYMALKTVITQTLFDSGIVDIERKDAILKARKEAGGQAEKVNLLKKGPFNWEALSYDADGQAIEEPDKKEPSRLFVDSEFAARSLLTCLKYYIESYVDIEELVTPLKNKLDNLVKLEGLFSVKQPGLDSPDELAEEIVKCLEYHLHELTDKETLILWLTDILKEASPKIAKEKVKKVIQETGKAIRFQDNLERKKKEAKAKKEERDRLLRGDWKRSELNKLSRLAVANIIDILKKHNFL